MKNKIVKFEYKSLNQHVKLFEAAGKAMMYYGSASPELVLGALKARIVAHYKTGVIWGHGPAADSMANPDNWEIKNVGKRPQTGYGSYELICHSPHAWIVEYGISPSGDNPMAKVVISADDKVKKVAKDGNKYFAVGKTQGYNGPLGYTRPAKEIKLQRGKHYIQKSLDEVFAEEENKLKERFEGVLTRTFRLYGVSK